MTWVQAMATPEPVHRPQYNRYCYICQELDPVCAIASTGIQYRQNNKPLFSDNSGLLLAVCQNVQTNCSYLVNPKAYAASSLTKGLNL
jgi:hypothetical protein